MSSDISLTSTTEVDRIAAKDAQDIMVMLSIKAPHYEPENRAPVDIMAVVDRSGSMQGAKLDLVKQTLKFMVRELKAKDRLGIVSFDHRVQIDLPLTYQNAEGQQNTNNTIDSIQTSGTTNLCGGLVQGITEMRNRSETNETSSVLLFTDGQANVGFRNLEDIKKAMMDTDSLAQQAINADKGTNNSMRSRSPVPESSSLESTNTPLPCCIYTFGYGSDHSESLLRGIAEHGEGVYYFIENNELIAESFSDCFAGLISVTSRDINLKFTVPDDKTDVSISKVHNKKYRETVLKEHKSYQLRIGDIQSEEGKDILFTMNIPAISQSVEDYKILDCSLEYFNVINDSSSKVTTSVQIERPEESPEGQQVNYLLDRQRNRIIAIEAMEEATEQGNHDNLEGAKKTISDAIDKIEKSISGNDAFCTGLIQDLEKLKKSLEDQHSWRTYGSKVAFATSSAHSAQRSTSTRAVSQACYQTSMRRKMKAKFT